MSRYDITIPFSYSRPPLPFRHREAIQLKMKVLSMGWLRHFSYVHGNGLTCH